MRMRCTDDMAKSWSDLADALSEFGRSVPASDSPIAVRIAGGSFVDLRRQQASRARVRVWRGDRGSARRRGGSERGFCWALTSAGGRGDVGRHRAGLRGRCLRKAGRLQEVCA